jgi:hypothetical protein
MMVTKESATRIGLDDKFHDQLPIDTDHSGLVKFSSRFQHYAVVWPRIERLVEMAHAAILGRFAVDKGLPNRVSRSGTGRSAVRQVESGV